MNWLAFLLTLIKVAEALSSYLSERRLISAEDAKVAADAVARVHNALVAGDAVDVSPDGLRRPDSNQRD
jgi:IS5 family transposase